MVELLIYTQAVGGSSPSPSTVAVAQLVERQVVALVVVGASPIGHPGNVAERLKAAVY